MGFIADLHIHSRFSRATSKQLDVPHLHAWGRRKGIGVLGTGDCIHPGWLPELEEHLVETPDGLYAARDDVAKAADADLPGSCGDPPRFILQTEISNIYKAGGRVRKVHNVILLSDFAAAHRLAARLDAIGNIRSDGRPILGLDSRDLLEMTLEADPNSIFIPAHIWTPWFSALGSKSGFDSIEECYRDLTPHIHAVETGLSSDPPMNWRVSSLDRFVLVSNSDAHSPSKLGREANLFEGPRTYEGIRSSLETGKGLSGTLEFFPEEGKYHLDGHRKCGVRLQPEETRTLPDLRCPACGRKLTVGVMHRVAELADRPVNERGTLARDFESLVSLDQAIGEVLGRGPATKGVQAAYTKMISALGSELAILRETPLEDIRRHGPPDLDEAVRRIREGGIHVLGGYDGEYGTVKIFEDGERDSKVMGKGLFGEVSARGRPPSPSESLRSSEGTSPTKGGRNPIVPRPSDVAVDGGGSPCRDLNPEQLEAVNADHPVIAVIAGPGTGKTRVLTARVRRLLGDGVEPSSILVVTFTRKAAGELRARLAAMELPAGAVDALTVETFHSLALMVLTILADRDLRVVDLADRLLLRKQLEGIHGAEHLDMRYRARLKALGYVDLDELIPRAVQTLDETGAGPRYSHLLVDEYQDIDPNQLRLLDGLRSPEASVFVIGDPDQSIYRFRGADPHCFAALSRWGEPMNLGLRINYRSAATVRRIAGLLLGRDPGAGSPQGDTRGRTPGPEVRLAVRPTAASEAEYIAQSIERLVGGTAHFSFDSDRVESAEVAEIGFGDVAVLARTGRALDEVEVALLRLGVPVQRPGRRDEAVEGLRRDLLALADAAADPKHQLAYSHLQAAPGPGSAIEKAVRMREAMDRGCPATEAAWHVLGAGDVAPDRRRAWEVLRPALPVEVGLDDLRYALATLDESEGVTAGDRVGLLSLHASKGLEYDVVFICGLEEGLLPHERAEGPEEIDEERRLLYVGLTRARLRIHLSRSQRRLRFGKNEDTQPSRFLAAVETTLTLDQNRRSLRRRGKPVQKTLF